MLTREQLAACRLVRHDTGTKVVFVDGAGMPRTISVVAREASRECDLVLSGGGDDPRTIHTGSERDCADILDDAADRMDVREASASASRRVSASTADLQDSLSILEGDDEDESFRKLAAAVPPRRQPTSGPNRLLYVGGGMALAIAAFVGYDTMSTPSLNPAIQRAPAVIGGELSPSPTGASDLEAMASMAAAPIDERRLGAGPTTPAAPAVQTASAAPVAPTTSASALLIDGEPAPEPGKGDEGIAVKADDPTVRGPAPAQPPIELPGGDLLDRADAAKADADTTMADARTQVASAGPEKATADLATMKVALEAIQKGEKLDPALLAQLPSDIARKLKEQGVLLGDKEAALVSGKKLSEPMVTLPETALAGLRDADGVPTVPATNFWAATGGNVRLPLPGGGDIVDPSIFAEFGL